MKQQLLLIMLTTLMAGCNSITKPVIEKDYEIVFDEGIYVEKFDSTYTLQKNYSADNQTYLVGNQLTYDYYYQDLKGNQFKFQDWENASALDFGEMVNAWSFVNMDSINDLTIKNVVLKVIGTNAWWQENNPDYEQTVISYTLSQMNGETNLRSSTGVIDNEMNIWIHPPRARFFRILEINPFPFIQAPYEIGHKWNWSLTIGSPWGDERWKTWEGSIENRYEYEITGKTIISTKIGEFECFEIKATAESSIGRTYLTAYFNREIGFVKLDYTNIDSTKTVLELVNFEKEE